MEALSEAPTFFSEYTLFNNEKVMDIMSKTLNMEGVIIVTNDLVGCYFNKELNVTVSFGKKHLFPFPLAKHMKVSSVCSEGIVGVTSFKITPSFDYNLLKQRWYLCFMARDMF